MLRRVRMGGKRGAKPPCMGVRGQCLRKNALIFVFIFGLSSIFVSIFWLSLIFMSIFGQFFSTWLFIDGFLFPVKELGLMINLGHWIRVLVVIGSYTCIVL
jgi:hypothetical protein